MKKHIKYWIKKIPVVRDYLAFSSIYYESHSKWRFFLYRYVPFLMKNKVYWPIHKNTEVRGNVYIDKGARVGHRPNCIIQGRGVVYVGKYAEIGPNSIVISGNHLLTCQQDVVRKETIIGDYCWIASSCVILAGITLGPRTVVGAGSVVTKSFPDGYCVIAGNPAKVIKYIPKDDFKPEMSHIEYYGYIRADQFERFCNRYKVIDINKFRELQNRIYPSPQNNV